MLNKTNKLCLLLVVFSFMFLFSSALAPIENVSAAGITIPANTGLPDPADTTGQGPVMQVTVNILGWILSIFMLLAIIAFVYTGILYLSSRGDQYQAESAKKSLVYAIIGVVAVAGALVLLNTIDTLMR